MLYLTKRHVTVCWIQKNSKTTFSGRSKTKHVHVC